MLDDASQVSSRPEKAGLRPARTRVEPVVSVVVGLVALQAAFPIFGCGGFLLLPDGDADGDGDAASRDADEDQRLDADEDEVDVPPQPGEWSALITDVRVLTDLCEVDGGLHNSLTSYLGDLLAIEIAQRLSENITGVLAIGDDGMLLYAPRCQDLASFTDPELDFGMLGVVRDGARSLARGDWLNQCGDTIFMMRGSLANGALHIVDNQMQFPLVLFPVPFLASRIDGTLRADGGEVTVCGYSTATALAKAVDPLSGLTFLEILVYPALALGDPTLQGVQPDIDVDRDGLERFVIDETSGVLLDCLDDDNLSIQSGRDCAANLEVADGFSFHILVDAAVATLDGCAPAWEETAAACDGGPSDSPLCSTDAGL